MRHIQSERTSRLSLWAGWAGSKAHMANTKVNTKANTKAGHLNLGIKEKSIVSGGP